MKRKLRAGPGKTAAVGYLRVSTYEQAQFGVSLDAQEERVRAYAVMAGLGIASIIREEGVSGGKPLSERPGGQRLLALLAEGKAQHVVILRLDRAFRDTVDCLTCVRNWESDGIAFHIVDMGGTAINTATAMGRMFLTMCAGFAELERGLISERTRTAMQHLREQGRIFGAPAFGTCEAERVTVARIIELKIAGLSLRKIAALLEAEEHKTKRGGSWAPETLRKILVRIDSVDLHRDPLYRGRCET